MTPNLLTISVLYIQDNQCTIYSGSILAIQQINDDTRHIQSINKQSISQPQLLISRNIPFPASPSLQPPKYPVIPSLPQAHGSRALSPHSSTSSQVSLSGHGLLPVQFSPFCQSRGKHTGIPKNTD